MADIKIQIKGEKESAQEFIRTGGAGLPEFRPNPFRPLGSYSGGNIFGGLEQEAGLNFLHLQVGSNNFRDMFDLNPAVSFVHSPAKLQHAARTVGYWRRMRAASASYATG
jgi:hypothetical protein